MPIIQPYNPGLAAFFEGASQVAGDIGQTRRRYRDEDRDQQALEESLASSRDRRRIQADDASMRQRAGAQGLELGDLRIKDAKRRLDGDGTEGSLDDTDLEAYDQDTRDALSGIDWDELPDELKDRVLSRRATLAGEGKTETDPTRRRTRRGNVRQSLSGLNRRELEDWIGESALSEVGTALSQGMFADNQQVHELLVSMQRALHSGMDDQGRPVDKRQIRQAWRGLRDAAEKDDYEMQDRQSVIADLDSMMAGLVGPGRSDVVRMRSALKMGKMTADDARAGIEDVMNGRQVGSGRQQQQESPAMKLLDMALKASGGDPKVARALFNEFAADLGIEAGEPDDGIPSLLRRPPGQTDDAGGAGAADYTVPPPAVTPEIAREANALPEDVREQIRELAAAGDVDGINKLLDEHMLGGSVLDKKKQDRMARERETEQARIRRGGVDPTMRR